MSIDNNRVFRRKTLDFTQVLEYINQGNKVAAKREIETLFRGITNENVGYGILKLIENNGSLISNDELAQYIEQKENESAKRKMATASQKHANLIKTANSQKQPVPNTPKCPTCGSTSLDKITAFDRGVAAGVFGMISKTARSQFRCRGCGYMF